MAYIGRYNTLRVIKEVSFGAYLDGGDLGEILIPSRYVPEGLKPEDSLEVFIYRDSEDRVIATTEKPYAAVGEFTFLKVKSVSEGAGAFLDWGLPKDLLVPFREQQEKMSEGESYAVYVYLDEKTGRIVASSRLRRFLNKSGALYKPGEKADFFVCGESDTAFAAVINNSHEGLIYRNEVFFPLKTGQRVKGYIKKIRADGKIDLSLQKPGYGKVDPAAQNILLKLEEAGGYIPVTDSSSPALISSLFGVSKKTYKKAVGALYKRRVISIEKEGIRIREPGDRAQ